MNYKISTMEILHWHGRICIADFLCKRKDLGLKKCFSALKQNFHLVWLLFHKKKCKNELILFCYFVDKPFNGRLKNGFCRYSCCKTLRFTNQRLKFSKFMKSSPFNILHPCNITLTVLNDIQRLCDIRHILLYMRYPTYIQYHTFVIRTNLPETFKFQLFSDKC